MVLQPLYHSVHAFLDRISGVLLGAICKACPLALSGATLEKFLAALATSESMRVVHWKHAFLGNIVARLEVASGVGSCFADVHIRQET